MEQNGFGGTAWAEQLQHRMREQRLTDSGRLLSPVLRPCFVTQQQVSSLAKTVAQLSLILDKLESMILSRPAWLNRLQLLPAEKSLLAVQPGYKHFSMLGSFDASFHANNCFVSGVDASRPVGLAYANALADVFLELPLVKEFKRSGHKITKLSGLKRISHSVFAAWQQFGGLSKPAIAVVDLAHTGGDTLSEGELLARQLASQGLDSKFVSPDKLTFENGELRAGERKIDLVVRRILAREILTRWELNHPLLEAYRARAVCVVNSFRAEIGQRRAFLELLSDDNVTANLTAAERKLLKQCIRWTRVMSARKVQHEDQSVDLPEWVLKNRERLTLFPDQPASDLRTYAGAEMSLAAWEFAVRQSLRSPYVVQESARPMDQTFPFFQYGEFKLRDVDVVLQPQVLDGELGDCTAVLQSRTSGSITPLGLAPVFLIQ